MTNWFILERRKSTVATQAFAAAIVIVTGFIEIAVGQPADLRKANSWAIPSADQIKSTIRQWSDVANLNPANREALRQLLQASSNQQIDRSRLDFVSKALATALPALREVLAVTERTAEVLEPHLRETISLASDDRFVQSHVNLLLMRWLIKQKMYDEAIEQTKSLRVDDVIDPVTLIFLRALAYHQLSQKTPCVLSCRQLLEREPELPRRIASLTQMMLADIEPLEEDTLDEIARLMNDVHRRQSLYRAGQKVRELEETVLGKLDKLIEKAEEEQKKKSQLQAGGSPSSPMQDSQQASGLGSGDVTNKSLAEGGQWGNLPPGERAAVLAELTKELPPHYRIVIEEYFRRLAQEEKRDQ
jgi:hypothetical protein